jgi:predicted YcjX-like family ATPase
MLSDDVSLDIVQKYFNKVIRRGDYYTLDEAKRLIARQGFHPKKEEKLIDALNLINSKRGISKAKECLEGKRLDDLKRTIRELEELRINPVTIPREWNIKRIQNLLDAYYDKISDEHFKEKVKQFERKELDSLYKKKKKKCRA